MISYGTIYTIPFKSIKEISYLIEIQKENYTGKSTELTGSGDSPFSVSIEDEDFLYVPTRFSTATIRIIGGDYLQNLFSISYQQYRVIFKRNDVVIWCGFIKPELYTQDYSSDMFELELECISAMSVLDFIDYKQRGESREFVSFWSLLKKCITSSNSQYTAIYFPHVYAKSSDEYAKGANVLEQMTISEQNFFDEDDKPMKLKEVLEEICKFLNWTCVDWRGELYFIDVDHTGEYYKYNLDLIQKVGYIKPALSDIRKFGLVGSDHSLDVLPGYNKATVRTSNYPVGKVIPEETFNAVVKRSGYGQTIPAALPVIPGIRGECIIKVEQTPSVYRLHGREIDNDTGTGSRKKYLGTKLYRNCIYSLVPQGDGSYKPDIKEYSYDNCVCAIVKAAIYTDRTHYYVVDLERGTKILSFVDRLPCAAYYAGAFCISASAAQSVDVQGYVYSPNVGSTSQLRIICKLEIAGNYWNGTTWTTAESTFAVPVNPERTGYTSVVDTKELGMPYSGVSGSIIELPSKPLIGALNFEMLTPECGNDVTAVYLKDFSIVYKKADGEEKEEEDNSDRYYENVVNENYINELDEIEFKISSYNNDGACYSKVMLGDNYLTNNLYSSIENDLIRPEELLIRKLIKQYGATKIKLTPILKNSDSITPISILTYSYMNGKKFIVAGGEIDFASEQFTCKMIEI